MYVNTNATYPDTIVGIKSSAAKSKRPLFTLLVVVMLVLAGCSGGESPADASSPTPADASSSTPSTESPSNDPKDTSFEETYDQYITILQGEGTYTIDYRFETGGSAGDADGEGRLQIDLERRTMYQTLTATSQGYTSTVEYYLPPDEDSVYLRFGSGGRTFYQKQALAESGVAFYSDPVKGDTTSDNADIESDFAGFPEFRDEGEVQTEMGRLHKYVIDDPSQLDATSQEAYEGQITNIEAVLYVDDSTGLPVKYEYEVTVDPEGDTGPQTVFAEVVYVNIGSTTVSEPGWFGEAKQQTR